MSLFTKRKITVEQQSKYDALDKERDEVQKLFESEPEGTKTKGDYLLEYIRLSKELHKIKTESGNKAGVIYLENMYKAGLRLNKWKK